MMNPSRLALLVGALFFLSTGCVRSGGEPAQVSANGGQFVNATHSLTQTVNPAGNQVKGIDVLVLAVAEQGSGNLSLTLAADGKSIAKQTVPIRSLDEGDKWVPFTFGQPANVPDVVDVQVKVEGDGAVLIGVNRTPENADPKKQPNHDPYPQGEATANGKPLNGDIAFQVVGTSGISALPNQVGAIAKEGVKRLTGQPTFATLWGIAIVMALGLTITAFLSSNHKRRSTD